MEEVKIDETIQFLDNNNQDDTTNNNSQEEELTDAFIKGLPDWDLVPMYEIVRRISRKWLIMNG